MRLTGNEKSKRSTAAGEKPTGPLVYIGPNLERGRLRQYTVFRDGIPKHLAPLIESRPEISRLLVPAAELSTAIQRAGTAGTVEYRAFAALKGGSKS
jgi:hypothetical protein